MNIYHLQGVTNFHYDYTRRARLEEQPDIKDIVKDKVKSILWELERVDYEDPTAAENSVDDGIRMVKSLETEIPSEVETFFAQENLLRGTVSDMTNNTLAVVNSLDLLISNLRTKEYSIDEIMERLTDIRTDMNDILCSSSTRLTAFLEQSGWGPRAREFVKNLAQSDPYMDVIAEDSDDDRMMLGIDDWLRTDGESVTFLNGKDKIRITPDSVALVVKNCKQASHNISSLGEYFTDPLNPTQQEMSVYHMATDTDWDILGWMDILKAKSEWKL